VQIIKRAVSRIILFLLVPFILAGPIAAVKATGDSQSEISRAGSSEVSELERGRYVKVEKVSRGAQVVKIGIEPSHTYSPGHRPEMKYSSGTLTLVSGW